MKLVHNTKPILSNYITKPVGKDILAEVDIGVTPRARLKMKLLVFKNKTALQKFWVKAFDAPVGGGCSGAVNPLFCEITSFYADGSESSILSVDPKYFCVMGLAKGHLNMEIICHESVHAGAAYARRHKKDMWVKIGDIEEESVCYPAGIIAAWINHFLYRKDLYE